MAMMISRRRLHPGEFDAWEERFRQRGETRKQAGCGGVRYFRSLDDPDFVTIIFDWETKEAGLAFNEAMLRQFPGLDKKSDEPGGSDYAFFEERPALPF